MRRSIGRSWKNSISYKYASATGRNIKESTKNAAQLMIRNLKAHGHIKTSYPLEDVLKKSFRNDAKLISYNEEPINVVNLDGIDDENLKLQETFDNYPVTESKTSKTSSSDINRRVLTRAPYEKEILLEKTIREEGGSSKTAKSLLHEICVANCWKPPNFTCCEEEGPDSAISLNLSELENRI